MNWLKQFKGHGRPVANVGSVSEKLTFEWLEARILLSADAIGGVIANYDDQFQSESQSDALDAYKRALVNQIEAQPHLFKSVEESDQDNEAISSSGPLDLVSAGQLLNASNSEALDNITTRVELVVVDPQVENYQQLMEGLQTDENVEYQVLILNQADEPIASISERLAELKDVSAIHLISHGEAGSLALGDVRLNSESIVGYQLQFERWQQSLTADADILIYGCDLAESARGQELISNFADATGADIAASTNLTGHSQLSGDWELEFHHGRIETQLAFGLDVQQSWKQSLLLITVNSDGDDSLVASVDSVAELIEVDQSTTLREAIMAVNKDLLANPGEVHTIQFDLTLGAVVTLTDSLPDIMGPVVIDGTLLNSANGEPVVTVSGGTNVFTLVGDGITVKGLSIEGASNHGVVVSGSSNFLIGNDIGSNVGSGIAVSGGANTLTGNTILGNAEHGVYITGVDNVIGGSNAESRNVISDNGLSGVVISGATAERNVVQGNYIGVDASGTASLGNARDGVEVVSGADRNTIGGSAAGAGNVISGNGDDGIYMAGGSGVARYNAIAGNIIGLDASATLALGNLGSGVQIVDGEMNTIGGSGANEGNIISANGLDGITLTGNSYSNSFLHNYIGADRSGSTALGNGLYGISITGNSGWSNQVETALGAEGAGNTIVANGAGGIYLGSGAYNIDIAYNNIGVAADGISALGNRGDGIVVDTGIYSRFGFTPSNVDISHNVIAFNEGAGVAVKDPYTYAVNVTQNNIYANTGLGIDLKGDGVTSNDDLALDGDYGENSLANYPVLATVEALAGEVRITGSVTYDYPSGSTVTVHFYYSDTQHASGHGDAKGYIGSYSFTAQSNQSESFDLSFLADVPAGSFITATTSGSLGTSEFAESVYFAEGNAVNYAPTGVVSVAGTLAQGALLTASNTLADQNGFGSTITYRWRRDGVDIEGATGETYSLTQADVGAHISVVAGYIDGDQNLESVESDVLGPVANASFDPTGEVEIVGVLSEYETLTAATDALFDADGVATGFSYQWLRDGVAIAGAVGEAYTLEAADVDALISVRVSYTDGDGIEQAVERTASAVIANVNDAPAGELSISGAPVQNTVLSVNHNISDRDGFPGVIDYYWLRDGAEITGARSETYTLTLEDVGANIQVEMRYQDGHGTNEVVTSAAVGPVAHRNSPAQGSVTIEGAATEYSTLTVKHDLTDADGVAGAFEYQWYRDGGAIDSAVGSTYVLSAIDIDSEITVTVRYTDAYGTEESVLSPGAGPVQNMNDLPVGDITISGEASEYQTLTANFSVSDNDGYSGGETYQWYRNGVAINGSTEATHTLTGADVGGRMSLVVTYVDGHGTEESISSDETSVVVATNNVATGNITIGGTVALGSVLSVSHNIVDLDSIAGTIEFQWQRDGEAIVGATGSSYELTAADSEATLSVLATFTDAKGFEEAILSNLVGLPVLTEGSEAGPEPAPEPELDPVVGLDGIERKYDSEPPMAPSDVPEEVGQGVSESEVSSDLTRSTPVANVVLPSDVYPALRVTPESPLLGDAEQAEFGFLANDMRQFHNDAISEPVKLDYVLSPEAFSGAVALDSLFPSLSESLAVLNDKSYSRDIEQSTNDIVDDSITLTTAVVGGGAALSTGLSVGYLIWTLRSGILITSLLSSMPAWRFIDPLPILSGKLEEGNDEDDESLQSLVADDNIESDILEDS